tara:strand:+ start:406 stop:678 length:273 start_codon:yes stop_codon:yes gene_type:complete
MYKTFTHNDLVRYLYGEMDNNEAIMLKKTLCFDDDLNASYINLNKTINSIDSLVYKTNSSELTIAKIKSFARGYTSNSSKIINTIDLILN